MEQEYDALEDYTALTEILGAKSYLPYTGKDKFEFSGSLSQHILGLPKDQREILREINKDMKNIYKYENDFKECPFERYDFYHFVIRIDLLVLCCGYYVDTETLETKYPVLEIVQGYFE